MNTGIVQVVSLYKVYKNIRDDEGNYIPVRDDNGNLITKDNISTDGDYIDNYTDYVLCPDFVHPPITTTTVLPVIDPIVPTTQTTTIYTPSRFIIEYLTLNCLHNFVNKLLINTNFIDGIYQVVVKKNNNIVLNTSLNFVGSVAVLDLPKTLLGSVNITLSNNLGSATIDYNIVCIDVISTTLFTTTTQLPTTTSTTTLPSEYKYLASICGTESNQFPLVMRVRSYTPLAIGTYIKVAAGTCAIITDIATSPGLTILITDTYANCEDCLNSVTTSTTSTTSTTVLPTTTTTTILPTTTTSTTTLAPSCNNLNFTTSVSCNSITDANVTINITGGTAPFQYSTDGFNYTSIGSNVSVLAASGIGNGFYTYHVKDVNNCLISKQFVIDCVTGSSTTTVASLCISVKFTNNNAFAVDIPYVCNGYHNINIAANSCAIVLSENGNWALPSGVTSEPNGTCTVGCTPNWQDVYPPETRCVSGNEEKKQYDGCGNINWTVNGNSCLTTTQAITTTVAPTTTICTPNWVDTGNPYCFGNDWVINQIDGCNNTQRRVIEANASQCLGCSAISNVVITGLGNVSGVQSNYGFTYTGDVPVSIVWTVIGQGASIIGSNNSNTVTVQFGTTGSAFISLTLTDCNGTEHSVQKEVVQTPACNEYPPSNLILTALLDAKVRVKYTDNAFSETGFEIQYSLNGSTWFTYTTVSENTTDVITTSLLFNTEYWFRVRNIGTCDTRWSSVVSILTGPKPVTFVEAFATGNIETLFVSWIDDNNNHTISNPITYEVEAALNNTACASSTFKHCSDVSAPINNYIITNCMLDGLYNVRVRSKNKNNVVSSWSNIPAFVGVTPVVGPPVVDGNYASKCAFWIN